jgi:hypothetical protein
LEHHIDAYPAVEEENVNAALVGANTVNGPVPCKVTANSALSKLELKYLGPLFLTIPVIVLSAGGV